MGVLVQALAASLLAQLSDNVPEKRQWKMAQGPEPLSLVWETYSSWFLALGSEPALTFYGHLGRKTAMEALSVCPSMPFKINKNVKIILG